MSKDELSTRFLFEKLLEREDKMLALFERIDDSLDGLTVVISEHNNIAKSHNENTIREHKELKQDVKGFSSIQKYFAISFGVLIIFAVGTEFIGKENIFIFLKALLNIQ